MRKEPAMPDLAIHTDLARQILTGFIHTEITRSGFSRAVLGLSGGLDSALSCFLAAEALGPENVLAVRMPYKTSSADSLEHAQEVIDQLGVQSLTVPITEMVDPLFERFPGCGPDAARQCHGARPHDRPVRPVGGF
jgi:NAD+ synthase